jgi:hypothetical protein
MKHPLILSSFALVALVSHGISKDDTPNMDWVPPQAMGDGLRSDETSYEAIPITLTPTPKKTSEASKYTRTYTVELARFGIHNDGTHAAETSKGINEALQHAKTTGANRIVFPPGTYLIDETNPVILDHKDTIVDLNGATLQIQTNGRPKYSVLEIVDGAENLRLTNGILRGDRDTHDYKTEKGTHEWGTALRVRGGIHLEIDHLTLTNGSGDGVSSGATGSRNRDELLAMIKYSVLKKHLESGAFSETGEKIPSQDAVRTIEPFDLSKCGGAFELGYPAGHQGFPFIKGRYYEVLFLDENKNLIERRKVPQYRKTLIPDGAKYGHFQFNQPEVSDEPAHVGALKGGWLVRITNLRPPTHVHFHHNVCVGNRRLGMAYCGGQKWLIEDNSFKENGGTNPGYGVDYEDGAELMQDVVFRRNTFNGNKSGDLVVCAGSELIFEDNVFEKNVITWGRPHNYIFRNNRFTGGSVNFSTRTGLATFENNSYSNCKVRARFDTKGVADGLVRKAGETIATPPLLFKGETFTNVESIGGTYLNFRDSRFIDSLLVAGEQTRLISIEGCTFENTSLELQDKGPDFVFEVKNNKGDLPVKGAGEHRKITAR